MKLSQRLATALMTIGLATCAPAAEYRVATWADGLDLPWSIAFLPDGSALVTELGGRLRPISADGRVGEPIANVPAVYFAGQGGLFDVVLHPDFADNRLVYLAYAEGSPRDNGTAIARGRLTGMALEDVEVIFRNFSRKDTAVHYGGRMAFLADGTLLLTTGDGFNYREAAQDVDSGLGKVLRMNDDGSAAPGNPFPGSPYVYSYGHRNPQGLAVSRRGEIWLHEHGPRGGDEVNRIEAGVNYGWPAITYGIDYSGAVISPYTEMEGMAQPVHYWTPSIAPSGLVIYEADLFPAWQGDLVLGALAAQQVRRLDMSGDQLADPVPGSMIGPMIDPIINEERVFPEITARIRDVRVGPEGALYILTPDRILRVTPARDG
jgi:glucose/arabinose dehydrogenase